MLITGLTADFEFMSGNWPQDLTLDNCLEALTIPKEFDLDEDYRTIQVQDELNHWKDISLQALRRIADSSDASTPSQDPARIIFLVSSFVGADRWTSETHRRVASEYLNSQSPLHLTRILTEYVKPLFVATPHPMINLESGRKLPKPAAGASSTADLYDHQLWKTNIGIANVLRYCVDQLSVPELEQRWPLIIPPIITLSDDREGVWRLRILPTISKLLDKAPADLLKRTGIQDLLQTSLNNTLLFTGNPESAELVRRAVPVILELVTKTTKYGSEERFNSLCQLLGKNIIGCLWVYATRDLDSINATYQAIPSIVSLLGIGTVRYLKVILPQLAFSISPQEVETPNYPLIRSALESLLAVIKQCRIRMNGWRWTVLNCVCKRWAVLQKDPKSIETECVIISKLLKSVCLAMEECCPGIRETEYDRILRLDGSMFKDLLDSKSEETSK